MIKELFLAIALGAVLGFGITGGFLTLNKSKENNQSKNEIIIIPTISSTDITVIPTQESKSTNTITIDSPENESIVNVSKVTVKGIVSPKNLVVIKTPVKIFNTDADSEGNFELNVDLESGVNVVQVTAIDPETNKTSESEILVTYSTTKI